MKEKRNEAGRNEAMQGEQEMSHILPLLISQYDGAHNVSSAVCSTLNEICNWDYV